MNGAVCAIAIVFCFCGCASSHSVTTPVSAGAKTFVGSTPAGAPVREFLGALREGEPCHYIAWQLALHDGHSDATRGPFEITAVHFIPATHNTNQSQAGPRVVLRGNFEIIENLGVAPAVYRLSNERGRTLSFAKIDDGLLHLLDANGSIAVGTGGWSYTLNAEGQAEAIVDGTVAATVPDMSYTIAPMAKGPGVFAVFEGRTPCHGISRYLQKDQHPGCTKAKWRVTLYQHPDTGEPSTCKVEGTLFRRLPREGGWRISKGMRHDAAAVVYELAGSGTEPPLLLWRRDRDVLFFLDETRAPLIGNAEFSYTLNRASPR